MNVMLGLLVPALLGVDYGWQQKPDGTIAYIVQVDAETFADMQRNGQSIGSALPAEVRGMISDFTFRVGRDPLPNQNTLPNQTTLPTPSTSPQTVTTAKPVLPIPDPISAEAANSTATPVRITAAYPGEIPGASTAPAGSTVTAPQTTTYNWGGTPPSVSIPQTAAPPGTQSWAQNTVPASSATVQPAMSTSGFPINPTAAPPGTIPNPFPTNSSSTASGAYPNSTAPPSLNNGPRITQPQPWQTPPREVTISARTPMEPNPPLTSTGASGSSGPNLNLPPPPGGNYPNNNYAGSGQPGFNNNPFNGNPQYQQQPPQYAVNNYPPNNGAAPQNGYPQQPQQGGMPQQQDPYFAQRNQVPQQQQQQQQRDPMAAHVTPVAGQPTTNAVVKEDDDWGVRMALLLIGFMTSLAANFYFGWNTYQLRERCRMLLSDRGAF
jgi:hypothetical protein